MHSPIIKVLAIRPFSYLLLSEIFSQLAMNLLNFILLIIVFEIANSNSAVSGVVLSFTLPALIFGIMAGVFVDRWNKKNVLVITNALRAVLVFLLVFMHQDLFMVYILSFLVSFVTQFFIPAETPIIPTLVKRELLMSANSLFSLGIFGTIIAAYAISGPILLFFGTANTFIILTLLFLLSSIAAFLIKQNQSKIRISEISFYDEIKQTFMVIYRSKKVYRALFFLTLLQTLVLVIAVIGPGYASEILKIDVKKFPLFFVTPAVIGMIAGAFIVGNILHNKPKEVLTRIGLIFVGISVLLFPYGSRVVSRSFVSTINSYLPNFLTIDILQIMIVLSGIMGFAFAFVFVPSNTIVQEETTDETRGKVYGALNTVVGAVSLFPVIAAGSLADLIGVSSVLAILGIFITSLAFLKFLFD